ncbi:ABC transporter transmembrane domain-containing protein [Buchnera aphidicola]|uniref:ABC transporter transmembrane domain-containing protein n=1 Tax=Buchnera aphidicola TaxID=9 RepID=UPI0031B8307E
MQLFKKISWYFRAEWKRYTGSIFLLIIISILQLLPPKIIGILIDHAMIEKKYTLKSFLLISSMLLIAIIIYILRYLWRILLFGAAYKLSVILRKKIYKYLVKKNIIFYSTNRIGDLMAKSTNDVDKIVFFAGEGVLTLIDSLVTGSSVIIMMFTQINFILTIICLIPMPIMTILIIYYGQKLYLSFQKSQKTFSNLNNYVQENTKNIYMIKNFGLEKYIINQFKKNTIQAKLKNIQLSKIEAKFEPIIYSAIMFSNFLAIIIGSYFVCNNYITIGNLTSFIMYLGLMVWPMLALAWMYNILERGNASWNRLQNIMNKNNFFIDKKENIIKKKKDIYFQIKKFNYENSKKSIIKNIFIKIDFNKTIGLCGPTGSGKSTIINLLQRNLECTEGTILYNNTPINHYKISDWRKNISVVNQSTFLFSDTIKNNITLGKKHATKKEIEYVTKITNIHHEIMHFPQQYNTKIGKEGENLSGGQKQRISIARSLLYNKEILVLDNALSAIDKINQIKIFKNINLWKKKKHTIIIVTHALYILNQLKEIIIINDGKVENIGTHDQLLKYNHWYKNMCKQQK